jgi:hypothetical protein
VQHLAQLWTSGRRRRWPPTGPTRTRQENDGYDGLSLWFATLPGPVAPRPALDGDAEADVAIVGAGYTGLWTAYHLRRLDPDLRVVVVEQQMAGYGASGRNGGWCSALFATWWPALARRHGHGPTRALRAPN